MPVPSDPNKIILRNNYYPKGLTAGEIYDYYTHPKIKNIIIKESDNRPILLFMKYDNISKHNVVRRKIDNNFIKLNESNYEDIISGYTLSLSVETEYPQNIVKEIIFDLDSIDRNKILSNKLYIKCIQDIENLFPEYKTRITNSASGFHLRIKLNNKSNRRDILNKSIIILSSNISTKYLINNKNYSKQSSSNIKKINIDLVAMNLKGAATIPYALCRNGLVCKDLTNLLSLDTFSRKECIINNFLKTL